MEDFFFSLVDENLGIILKQYLAVKCIYFHFELDQRDNNTEQTQKTHIYVIEVEILPCSYVEECEDC